MNDMREEKSHNSVFKQKRVEFQKFLSEQIDLMKICQKCRMCLRVCPTYMDWYTEGPYGRIIATYYHYKYGIGSKQELSALLFTCTTCKKCQVLCKKMAMGVQTTDLIIAARKLLVEEIEIGKDSNNNGD